MVNALLIAFTGKNKLVKNGVEKKCLAETLLGGGIQRFFELTAEEVDFLCSELVENRLDLIFGESHPAPRGKEGVVVDICGIDFLAKDEEISIW